MPQKKVVLNKSHHVHKKSKERFKTRKRYRQVLVSFFFKDKVKMLFYIEKIFQEISKNRCDFNFYVTVFYHTSSPYSLVVKTLLFHSKIEGSIPSKGK